MFKLSERTVVLSNFNPRVENSGDDKVPAADLKCEIALPNVALSLFDPSLKDALYCFDEQRGGDLVDVAHRDENPGYAPHLRFPKMGPLSWDMEITEAMVTIAYGVSGRDIVLQGCKVNKFQLEPMDGGTVATSFRIQGHPDGEAAGKLYDLQGCEITISVEPPVMKPAGDLADRAGAGSELVDKLFDDGTDTGNGEEQRSGFDRRGPDEAVPPDDGERRETLDRRQADEGGQDAGTVDDGAGEPMHEIRPFQDGFLIYLGDTPTAGAQKFVTHEDAEKYLQKHLGIAQPQSHFERTEPPDPDSGSPSATDAKSKKKRKRASVGALPESNPFGRAEPSAGEQS